MIKKIIGKIWRKTPAIIRTKLVRATQKKFTVSVGAVVTNEKNEVLLLNHVFRPASGWGIPGGFIEHDEQIIDAIKRELLEETNLELENVEIYQVQIINRHVEFLVRARAKGRAEVKSLEIRELGWFKLNALPEKMSRVQKQIIREVLSNEPK